MKKILSFALVVAVAVSTVLFIAQPKAVEAYAGGVGTAVINATGAGYAVGETADVGGAGTGGIIEVTSIGALGIVTGIKIVNPGSGYVNAVGVATSGASIVGDNTLTIDVTITNGIGAATVNVGGTGYVTGDEVQVSGGDNNARLIVTAVLGVVTDLTVKTPGSGYIPTLPLVPAATTVITGAGDAGLTVNIVTLSAGSAGAVTDEINVTQIVTAEITMTAATDVVMSPSLPGITGGVSNGTATWTVKTNDSSGYNMNIASTPIAPRLNSDPALQYHDGASLIDSIADYALVPTYDWAVIPANSSFGFTVDEPINGGVPAPLDTILALQDNGAACGAGGLNTASKCWSGLNTLGATIPMINRASPTDIAGELITVNFRAEVGSARYQTEGAYQATVTVTATTN